MTGWREVAIKEICQVDWGNTSLTKKSYTENGEFLAVSAAGCDGRMGHSEHKKHTPVLSAIGANCGRMFFPEEDFTAIKNTITLTPIEGISDNKFLYYLLIYADLPQRGAGQPFISKGDIEKFHISLPPMEEQKRIVDILDEAFEGIEKAQANTEKNLANAAELFESCLDNIFSQSTKWKNNLLGEIATINYGYTAKAQKENLGPKFLRITDIQNGKVDWENVPYCEIDQKEYDKHVLLPDDIVFARTGATTGKSYLLKNPPKAVAASYLIRLRVHEGIFHPAFLSLFFQTPAYWNEIKSGISGSAQGGFNASKLAELSIPTPPIEIQKQHADLAKQIYQKSVELKSVYSLKLKDLAELKQSLLEKAFSGELTANNVVAFTHPLPGQQSVETTSPEFGAHVIAYGYHWHEGQRKNRTYGHVKTQKFLHLAESIANIDLGRSPEKYAAGPHDAQHMRQVEDWARTNEFFEFVQRGPDKGYTFTKLANYNQLIGDSINGLKPYQDKIQKILSLLLPMNTREAEVLATVHAAWNNLLLDGIKPTEDAIIHEARENWTDSKRQVPRQEFLDAIKTIRSNGIVPDGTAKRVIGQESMRL